MIYWFKRKWRQIKRVWDFLPIIWRGYDWDYRYAVELFQHQLKRTANEIENRGFAKDAKNTASKIRTAVELLEKVYDEDYAMEYIQKIEERYGPSHYEWTSIEDVDQTYWDIKDIFEEDYTEAQLLLIAEERNEEMRISQLKQARAHRVVWQYIEHNIRHWWD